MNPSPIPLPSGNAPQYGDAQATAAHSLQLPAPGLVLTLVGYFGLLFAVHKLQNSAWALGAVFALTGYMGYTLGPVLTHALALPGGAQTVSLFGMGGADE